ncbi:MAG TPA: GNAT family N-acetyltransferase [Pontiella sp.]
MTRLLLDLFSIETDFTPDPQAHAQGLDLLMQCEDAALFVAETDHRIVGMCTVQVLISTAMGGKVGKVEDVVVDAEHRGMGIGSSLLQAVEEWAGSRQLSRLQLQADRNNHPALRFYERQLWNQTQLIGYSKILPC